MARILVVDDDDLVRETIATVLEAAGHEAARARDGGAALALLRSAAFDLVITDIFMPGVEGMETIREIRRIPGAPPVIAISGGPRDAHVALALIDVDQLSIAEVIGACCSVRKPVSRSKLIQVVESCLSCSPAAGRVAAS